MRIGLIGAGIISESHAKAISALGGVELAGTADIATDKAQSFARRYGGGAYVDYRAMLEAERPDAAIVTLPHSLHAEAAAACAELGIHVLMEKPMAVGTAGCDAMIDACRRGGVTLMVAHIGHYFPENCAAREFVATGRLGPLVSIADTRNADYFTPDRPRWFLNKALAGGGIFMNLGAHSIDKILFLTGSRVKRIEGAVTTKPGYDVEGAAQAFIELACGVSATVMCNGFKTPYLNETMLHFTDGTLRLRTGEGLWASRGGEYEPIELPQGAPDPFVLQLRDFIDSVERGTEPPISGEYGREVIRAIETVYRCAAVMHTPFPIV